VGGGEGELVGNGTRADGGEDSVLVGKEIQFPKHFGNSVQILRTRISFQKTHFPKKPNQNMASLSTEMVLFCSTSTTVSKSSRKEGSVSVETSQKLCSFSRAHQKWRFPKET